MEKHYLIPNSLVGKLADKSREVRDDALNRIINILENNINFDQQHAEIDETDVVNLPNLVKTLIRASIHVTECSDGILNILGKVLKRHDLIRIITKSISLERLRKELQKILNLNNISYSDRLQMKVSTIEKQLESYEERIKRDFMNSSSLISFDSPTSDILLSSMSELSVEENVKFWDQLESLNLDYFNGIAAELRVSDLNEKFDKILPHLISLVDDYPAEFFLQGPRILHILIEVLPKISTENAIEIFKIFSHLTRSMEHRLIDSRTYERNNNQGLMLRKAVASIERVLISYIDYFVEESFFSVVHNLDLLSTLFSVIFAVTQYALNTENIDSSVTNELLNKLAELTRLMRHRCDQKDENFTSNRIIYVNCVYILNLLIASIPNTEVPTNQSTNLWEDEMDIALLDGSLQFMIPQMYTLLKENRKKIIDVDEDLKRFLSSEQKFRPVVRVLHDHESLSVEEIVELGEKALDTIRIHRSIELVSLLLQNVHKAYKSSSIDQKTRHSAENVYLRLLSIGIASIRRLAYKDIKSHMAEFIESSGIGCSASETGTDFLGFPLNSEIFAAILCFGYFDQDEEIAKHAKFILFTLLRSNTFGHRYQKILPVMKPALELSSCLTANSPQENGKILTIAFETLQANSMFTEEELYFSIARFLYTKNFSVREMAKTKLLNYLQFDKDLISIVPSDLCILNQKLVRSLIIPQNTNFDQDEYDQIAQLLKAIDRSDEDILRPLLLRFDILMSSRVFCQKSHDDHLWVYFVGYLDWSHPTNAVLRQITVNVLLQWALVVNDFRVYMAQEKRILHFLIDTLVSFNDNDKLKAKASSLLFLLLFSNFVVTSEKNISMPKVVSTLECPFKFDEHWVESPYDTITEIEDFMEAMEKCQVPEKQELICIFRNFFKFSFQKEWHGWSGERKLTFRNPAGIPDRLRLKEDELKQIQESTLEQFGRKLGEKLDNASTFTLAQAVIVQIEHFVVLYQDKAAAEILNKKIQRFLVYRNSADHLQMLRQIMKIYQRLMKFLCDESIVEFAKHEFFTHVLKSEEKIDENFLTEVMKTVLAFVKRIEKSEKVLKLLPKNFCEDLVPLVLDHIFVNVMGNDHWYEAKQKIHVKPSLMLLRQLFEIVKYPHDSLLNFFNKFISIIPNVYRSHSEHIACNSKVYLHSGIMTSILDVLLKIASILATKDINFTKWRPEVFRELYMWSSKDNSIVKFHAWLIFAELTQSKSNFDSFSKNFEEIVRIPFFSSLRFAATNCLLSPKKSYQLLHREQNAIVSVISQIIEHSAESIAISTVAKTIDKLMKSKNTTALCCIVRKLILNEFEGLVDLVKSRDLIVFLMNYQQTDYIDNKMLENLSERFETVAICSKHQPLKEYVIDVMTHQISPKYILLIYDGKSPRDSVHRKFDLMVINLILLLMHSETGVIKLSNYLDVPKIIDRFMLFSHEMMISSGRMTNVTFMLHFWNQLITSSLKFEAAALNLISTYHMDMKSHRDSFKSCDTEMGKIVERETGRVTYGVDLLFIQVVSVFNANPGLKVPKEKKQEIDSLCLNILRELTKSNERMHKMSKDLKLLDIVYDKLSFALGFMQSNRHQNVTANKGVAKAQMAIKDVVILTSFFLDLQFPLAETSRLVRKVFGDFLRVSDWLEADSYMMNSFFRLLSIASSLDIGHYCSTQSYDGKPLIKSICMRTQALSLKSPHTETCMSLIKNGVAVMIDCAKFVDVRQTLKSLRVIKVFETLQVHLEGKKKAPWEEISVVWLQLLECLSKFEDAEFAPNDVSILCRLIRIGNPSIRKTSLAVIMHAASNNNVGIVLLSSDHFKQTIVDMLSANTESTEMIYILQTLLSIASHSESQKAKLKSSSLNRRVKDFVQISRGLSGASSLKKKLSEALYQVLYS